VTDLLVKSFPDLFRIEFTAQMEQDLDLVAEGQKEWQPVCAEFFTKLDQGLNAAYDKAEKLRLRGVPAGTAIGVTPAYQPKPNAGSSGSGKSSSKAPASVKTQADKNKKGGSTVGKSKEVSCPKCGEAMKARQGAKGEFYGCSKYPECKGTLPK
jgi:DNA topoisomerase-1